MTIQNFIEIRRDGKVIDESMKVEDVIALGAAEKILDIQWRNGLTAVSVRNDFGILAKVVDGREFVVANEHDESGKNRTLSVLNADGSRRLSLPKTQRIREQEVTGEYCWFEPARVKTPHVFGVVFSVQSDNAMFQLDVDAQDGRVIGVYPMR